ncbi:MAG: hypothetical protein IIC83_12090 [Chloroflexi bacterium]|nr:hypothetical protein [Chloroflexota bacterium]
MRPRPFVTPRLTVAITVILSRNEESRRRIWGILRGERIEEHALTPQTLSYALRRNDPGDGLRGHTY